MTEPTTTALTAPVRDIAVSDVFGSRINPITGLKEIHKGIDLAVPVGTPVLACGDGRVISCGHSDSYGNFVKVKGSRYTYLYAHLSELSIHNNEDVKQGQTLAYSGNTGRSTGPHLHFELYDGDKNIDPYFVVKESAAKPNVD